MMKWLVLASVVALCMASCNDPMCMPNIDVLGSGFNILYADVNDEAVMPGGPILRFVEYAPAKSSIPWLIPTNATVVIDQQMCSGQTSVRAVSSVRDYYSAWESSSSSSVGLSVSVASFSSSKSSRNAAVSNMYYSESTFAYLNEAQCTLFDVRLDGGAFDAIELEERFTNEVQFLPTSFEPRNYGAFANFIKLFGTHVVTRLRLGGYIREAIGADMYQDAVFNAIEGSSEDATSFGFKYKIGVDVGSSSSSSQEAKNYEAFQTISAEACFEYVGGTATERSYDAWAASLPENPVPVSYEWELVSSLLTPRHFPDDPLIDDRRQALHQAVWGYVQAYGGLSALYPTPRRESSELRDTNALFRSHTVKCADGEVLLGAGCYIPTPPDENAPIYFLSSLFPRSSNEVTCTGVQHGGAKPTVQNTAVIPVGMCVPETLSVTEPFHVPGGQWPTAVKLNSTVVFHQETDVKNPLKREYTSKVGCPADHFLTGGGCVWTSDNQYYFRQTRSSPSGEEWQCNYDVDLWADVPRNSLNPTFSSYAICASYEVDQRILGFFDKMPLDVKRVVVEGEVGSKMATAEAVCPHGFVVLGGGCDAKSTQNGSGVYDFAQTIVQNAPGSASSWACRSRLTVGTTKPQSVIATAICGRYQLEMVDPSNPVGACS